MIKNWNSEVKDGEVFFFKNSHCPFTCVTDTKADFFFLNIEKMELYTFEELELKDFYFYRKDDDEDFLGVDVDGRLEWVD